MGQKKLVRKAEPSSKRGIAWPRWTGFRGMTARDWLPIVGALLVPTMVALGTWAITWQLAKLEDERAQQAQKIENQRAKAERELAEQRADDEALQAYLDQMASLLLERDLRTSKEDSEVRTLARARTLTVLGRLDPSRKTALMQFLVEADLVQRVDGSDPIISLRGADLNNANLRFAIMPGAVLSQANLNRANLIGADLSHAIPYKADLSFADLRNANLRGANLIGADLTFAGPSNANLHRANLSDANLIRANLSDANLSDANLSDASGITNEKLDQQAASLEGATMPNGQKYEDWLKAREKRQQDE